MIKEVFALRGPRLRSIVLVNPFQIQKGDVVSLVAPNVPAPYEAHLAVPMAGAILNTINTRLDARQRRSKLLLVDYQSLPLAKESLSLLQGVPLPYRISSSLSSPCRCSHCCSCSQSMGEIMLRGSSIMKAYLYNAQATTEAFAGGWFHTGDVGVVRGNKRSLKGRIISGGENISSVEVDSVLYTHALVSEAAVVAMPHSRWGEKPCAFINTKDNNDTIIKEEIVSFCRDKLKTVVFMSDLPKTSNGKIQKTLLRERDKNLSPTSTA